MQVANKVVMLGGGRNRLFIMTSGLRSVHDKVLGEFFDERGVPGHFLFTEVVATAKGEMNCFHCARRRRIARGRASQQAERVRSGLR